MLTERQIAIFKAIVDEFTRTAEPVGSKTLMNLLLSFLLWDLTQRG